MVNREEIGKEVIGILADNLSLKPEAITFESEIIRDLKADSLDIMEIVMVIEEKYEIDISDDDVQKIQTVNDIISFIENNNG